MRDAVLDPLLPICDPWHEVLLDFELPWWSQLDPEENENLPPIPTVALQANTELLWSITVKVPFNTPKIRSSNVFRVRVMDANKVATDGNLWLPGEEARNWWSMVVTGHSCGVIMQTESGLQVWKLFCNSILYYIILHYSTMCQSY
ncbi:Uncharacterized protein SCF082_LOCUS19478 [Durusdinium trenchii]|uniref:Uncharacterized protein n=1 Tax=Durusdinium trenchii TaxID=1381693 RepID=A0ABP0KXH4_9DINO